MHIHPHPGLTSHNPNPERFWERAYFWHHSYNWKLHFCPPHSVCGSCTSLRSFSRPVWRHPRLHRLQNEDLIALTWNINSKRDLPGFLQLVWFSDIYQFKVVWFHHLLQPFHIYVHQFFRREPSRNYKINFQNLITSTAFTDNAAIFDTYTRSCNTRTASCS